MASKSKPVRRSRSSKPQVPVRGVDFIMYCTKNMPRTRAFYEELFGFKPGGEWNNFWSEFDTAPVTLCLNGPSKRRRDRKWDWQGPAAIALAVPDVKAAIHACRRRKVKVLLESVETSVCWMSFIADPDGNRICLHQRKDGTAG